MSKIFDSSDRSMVRKEEEEDENSGKTTSEIISKVFALHADSTAHGYHNIFKTKLVFVRVMWIIFFATAVAFCGWLIVRGVITYVSYEVNSKIRINAEQSIDLPMISICNSKPFMTQYAYDYFISEAFKLAYQENRTIPAEDASVLYGNYTNASSIAYFGQTGNDYIALLQSIVADPSFNATSRAQFGLDKDTFILNTTFAFNPLTTDYYRSYYDPFNGNCVQFNSGYMQNGTALPLFEQTLSGAANGYMGVFFIDTFPNQSYNFMNLLSSYTFGIKISINDQFDIPLTVHNMIPIKPASCTNVALKKSVVTNLPQPFSSCQDLTGYHSVLYDKFVKVNRTYSQRVCYELCKQMQTISKCNCSFIAYPNVDQYTACSTLAQVQCARSIYKLDTDTNYCDQYCPLECESTYYDYTISSDFFPDEIYYQVFSTDSRVVTQFANAGITNISYDALANSLVCMFVFFEDLRTNKIEELENMSVIDFFAYLGGTIGLCCGMSILSFCELFEVFVEILHILIKKNIKRRKSDI